MDLSLKVSDSMFHFYNFPLLWAAPICILADLGYIEVEPSDLTVDTPVSLEQAFKTFQLVDQDSNGMINMEEFVKFVKALGGVHGGGDAWLQLATNAMQATARQDKKVMASGRVETEIIDLKSGQSSVREDCSSIEDLNECVLRNDCFPHYNRDSNASIRSSCVEAEQLPCLMNETEDAQKKMLFLSDGLSNTDLKHALRQLILQLPSESWIGRDGAAVKAEAQHRSVKDLAAKKFFEPQLYMGLKVLVIKDACFFKQFDRESWPCEDFKPVLEELGFESERVISQSIFDHVPEDASPEMKAEHTQLKNQISLLESSKEIVISNIYDQLMHYQQKYFSGSDAPYKDLFPDLLFNTSLVTVNGGNADFVTFALTKFVPRLSDDIRKKVREGSMVYMGRSAGAMAGAADVGLSVEASSSLTDNLLRCQAGSDLKNLQGMTLAGRCAIRPHYAKGTWDIASEVYERSKGLNVVRMPNGEGMMCVGAECKMVGIRHNCVYTSKEHPPNCTVPQDAIPHHQGDTTLSYMRRPCVNGHMQDTPFLEHSLLV